MGHIPENILSEVRARADLIEVVGQSVTLTQRGREYWGLCPFHEEKTPSFKVNAEKQTFHCFGCQTGGDVFGFRMRHAGLEFPDAVRSLAREVGVTVPETGGTSSSRTAALHRANEAALEFFRETLRSREGEAARHYLGERGVSSELADRFQIGLAPPRWDGLLGYLARNGHEARVAEQAGLVKARATGNGHYDLFRGRVVFPITDPAGNVLGFGGRASGDDQPKYLNTPESPIYHKGSVLFGMAQALEGIRNCSRAVVVEGYFDVLALHRAGIPEAVAPCGTALTREHARRLRRYVPEVILLFDADEAGQRATELSLPILLAEGIRVLAAELPAGEDPATLLAKQGAEALADCVEHSTPLLEKLIDAKLPGGSEDAVRSGEAVRSLAPYLKALENSVEQAAYFRSIAARLGVPPSAVAETVRSDPARSRRSGPQPAGPEVRTQPEPAAPARLDLVSRQLIEELTSFPELEAKTRELDLAWIPPGAGRELLGQVMRVLREGQRVEVLLSPESEVLDPASKTALSRILARAGSEDLAMAQRAVSDCIDRLQREVRQARLAHLREELAKSSPADQDGILEQIDALSSSRRQPSPEEPPSAV
ncbi:MAG: DNA primase [Myxococcales bacterium]|nr:DNA primase [Myxococcales bacterium]